MFSSMPLLRLALWGLLCWCLLFAGCPTPATGPDSGSTEKADAREPRGGSETTVQEPGAARDEAPQRPEGIAGSERVADASAPREGAAEVRVEQGQATEAGDLDAGVVPLDGAEAPEQPTEGALETSPERTRERPPEGPPETVREWAPGQDPTQPTEVVDRNKRRYRVGSFHTLFGSKAASDTTLQQHRRRLLEGYFISGTTTANTNAEARARILAYLTQKTQETTAQWDARTDSSRGAFVVQHQVGLWRSLETEAKATFLSITRALDLILVLDANKQPKKKADGTPLTALDGVKTLFEIHGFDKGAQAYPNTPPLGEFRLGVTYTSDCLAWLKADGPYAHRKADGSIKQTSDVGRHGIHSTHKGFDDWGASAGTPNLQWQFRKQDNVGEIDIDYDHHGIWNIFASTKGNSDILTIRELWPSKKDHLDQFTKEFAPIAFTRIP